MKTRRREHHFKGGRALERSLRIDLGLAVLSAVAVPGVRYTLEEIAAFADCTKHNIFRIQTAALRKLRKRLREGGDPVLEQLLAQITGRAA